MNKLNFFDNFTYAKNTILIFLLLLLFISSAFAQEKNNLQPKKIALIAWGAFESPETGIKKYGKAIDVAYNSGCIFDTDVEKIKKLREEGFKQRYKLFVEPIKLKISDLLNQIEIENDLIILDGAELEETGRLLAWDKKTNITDNVILFANDFFKTGVKPLLKLNLPEAKIAVIDTESLKPETINLSNTYEALQKFAEQKGFRLILDSSKTFPSELEHFPKQDVTKDFITYYNQLNS